MSGQQMNDLTWSQLLNAKAHFAVNAQYAFGNLNNEGNEVKNLKVKNKNYELTSPVVLTLAILSSMLFSGCTTCSARPNRHLIYEMREPGGPRRL
ncbi:hypothetical protein WDW37_08900 [Bdellovibrionota bacterium FG-1]